MKQVLLLLVGPALWAASASAQSAGSLLVSEFMANPNAVPDASGEYVELYNTTDAPIDINGCVLSDDGTDSHTIANGAPLLVPTRGFLVLGTSADTAMNGGAPVGYVYSGFTLANGDDEIVLTCGSTVVTRVTYADGDPFGAGVSSELDNVVTHPTGVLVSMPGDTDFQAATLPYGSGDLGSPGSFGTTLPVGVEDGAGATALALGAPVPNPATGAVRLEYTLSAPGDASLSVFDALGRRVAVLAEGTRVAGTHEVIWDAAVAPGVYVVRLAAVDGVRTRRVVVVR